MVKFFKSEIGLTLIFAIMYCSVWKLLSFELAVIAFMSSAMAFIVQKQIK
jgi:hypothetical protein